LFISVPPRALHSCGRRCCSDACSTRRGCSALVGRGRGTVGGGAALRPARASTRCRAWPPRNTRSSISDEHSPQYL